MSQPDYSVVLRGIIDKFRSGEIPEAVALSMFPIPEHSRRQVEPLKPDPDVSVGDGRRPGL